MVRRGTMSLDPRDVSFFILPARSASRILLMSACTWRLRINERPNLDASGRGRPARCKTAHESCRLLHLGKVGSTAEQENGRPMQRSSSVFWRAAADSRRKGTERLLLCRSM